jgi:hypothetical protein
VIHDVHQQYDHHALDAQHLHAGWLRPFIGLRELRCPDRPRSGARAPRPSAPAPRCAAMA